MPNLNRKIKEQNDAKHQLEKLRERQPKVIQKGQLYKAKYIRLTNPRIPYRSTRPVKKVRRTILPQFVKVHKNITIIEIPEIGLYAEIAAAHLSLEAAPRTPLGYANMYGGIKQLFSRDVALTYTLLICYAVNCQLCQDSPLVLEELRTLFANLDLKVISKQINST